MRFIRRFSNLTLSIALVASAFGVSLLLPLPAKAQATSAPQAPSQTRAQGRGIQAMPKAYPVRDFFSNPERDKERLTRTSPALHAERIKTPLMVVQGARDPRVNKAESDQMVEALKKRGVDVPYMVKDNEGHGFRNEENQYEFYVAMEAFLGKHLKPQLPPRD